VEWGSPITAWINLKMIYSKNSAMKKSGKKIARMDAANRAMCFALRNPPGGAKPMKFKDIRLLVKKTDGRKPNFSAIHEAAASFKKVKEQTGRPAGTYKTSKAEDKKVLQTFRKLRPPGHGVDSRVVHKALPQKLQKKIGRRTVIRRLAKKGFGVLHLHVFQISKYSHMHAKIKCLCKKHVVAFSFVIDKFTIKAICPTFLNQSFQMEVPKFWEMHS